MAPFWPFHFNLYLQNDDDGFSVASSTQSLHSSTSTSCLVTEPSKRRRITTSVSFCSQATQFDHLHIDELTKEEKANAWYSRSELHAIQESNNEAVRWMLSGCNSSTHPPTKEDDFCCRGLEYQTPAGLRTRLRHRSEAIEACLMYQSSEWNHGRPPRSEGMAEVYRKHTQNSSQVAQLAAKVDHASVLAYETASSLLAAKTSPIITTTFLAPTVTTTPTIGEDVMPVKMSPQNFLRAAE